MNISEKDIHSCQEKWIQFILEISQLHQQKIPLNDIAKKHIESLYDFEDFLQFKPTLATKHIFRHNLQETLSYFISGIVKEDEGFALKNWQSIVITQQSIKIMDNIAIAMGQYQLTLDTNDSVLADFTFVYKKNSQGTKIIAHHSSLTHG